MVNLSQTNAGSICCIWNLGTPGVAQLCCEVRLHSRNLSCMAVGHDFQRRHREEDRRVQSPVSGNARRLSHAGLVARDFLPAAQVATSGDNSRIVVHEIRTGFRSFFDIADVEGDRRSSSVSSLLPRILRFASSGRVLAVGDNCGQVHLFQLGHSAGEAGRSTPAHRVLCLSGEVVDIVLHDEQLARVACWHAANAQREHPDKEEDLHPGEENKVLVFWYLLNGKLFTFFCRFCGGSF